MVKKDRVDIILVERGMVPSREKARALIMAGKVRVDGKSVTKPGIQIKGDAQVHLEAGSSLYVSRGGEKIAGALKAFGVDPRGMIVMDVGASTGGFTDCILQKGAKKVYAVDVGYGQLAWRLQKDPRVINLERRNIRYLPREEVQEETDLIVVDTSFISIEKFLPHLLGFLKRGGVILSLIKPQFEVGKGEVGKGGVVRDKALHEKVIDRISNFSRGLGLTVLGVTESPLLCPKGNRAFFVYLKKENGTDGQTEGTGTG